MLVRGGGERGVGRGQRPHPILLEDKVLGVGRGGEGRGGEGRGEGEGEGEGEGGRQAGH